MQSNYQTLIDLFISGKATKEQLAQIETLKKSDAQFTIALEQELVLDALSKKLAQERISAIVGKAWDVREQQRVLAWRKFIPLSIAASIVLAVAAVFFIGKSVQQSSNTSQIAAQTQPTPQTEQLSIHNSGAEPAHVAEVSKPAPARNQPPTAQKSAPVSKRPQVKPLRLTDLAPNYSQISAFFSEDVKVRSNTPQASGSELIKQALDAFEKGDYMEVVRLIKDYKGENEIKAKYLLSISYFNLGEYTKSLEMIPVLQKSLIYETEAEWLTLINKYALKQDVRKDLDAIIEIDEHPYRQKAVSLKNSLKQ